MQIELTPVQSSRIQAIGYSEETFTLAVKFPPTKSSPQGKTYHYEGFAPEQWEEFQSSESIGKYFGSHILNNPDHPFVCVDEGTGEVPAESPKTEEPVYLEAVPVPEPAELPEDEEGLKSRALEVKQGAQNILVRTPQGLIIQTVEAYTQAGAQLVQIAKEKKIAQARVDRIKSPAYQTYKEALQLEKDVIGPYDQAEQWLKGGIADYNRRESAERHRKEQEERRRREEQARLDAEREAKERAEQEAAVLVAQGEPEVAAQVLASPLPVMPARVAPVIMQKEVPKVEGVSTREKWAFRITDPNLIPREYLIPDLKAIGGVVRSLKGKTNIAGVEAYDEGSVAVRS